MRPGQYKLVDDITGEVFYSDDLVVDWDGSIRHRHNADGKHPLLETRILPVERQPDYIREPVYDQYIEDPSTEFYTGTKIPKLRN